MKSIGVGLGLDDLVDEFGFIRQKAEKDSKVLHYFVVDFDDFRFRHVVINNFDLLAFGVLLHKLVGSLEGAFHFVFFGSEEDGVGGNGGILVHGSVVVEFVADVGEFLL